MSMNYEEDSVGIHFTWKREPDAVQEMVAQIEDALSPFEARPHWGKVLPGGRSGNRPALQAPFRLRPPGGAARPARRVPHAWLKARVLRDK